MTNKVLIVTGASRGIGRATAQYLLQQSHNVVVVARSEAPLQSLQEEYPRQVAVLAGDFSDPSLGTKAVELATSRWGCLDGVVVNHGTLGTVGKIADASTQEWSAAFNVNFFSAVALVQAALPLLRHSRGRIVLVSSGAAVTAYRTWGSYGSSKAALNHLALTLANEETQVTTVALRPGVVDTQMQTDIREKHHPFMEPEDAKRFAQLKSSGSLLRPEQPGHVMARLALEAHKELSGKFLSWNAEELAPYQDSGNT